MFTNESSIRSQAEACGVLQTATGCQMRRLAIAEKISQSGPGRSTKHVNILGRKQLNCFRIGALCANGTLQCSGCCHYMRRHFKNILLVLLCYGQFIKTWHITEERIHEGGDRTMVKVEMRQGWKWRKDIDDGDDNTLMKGEMKCWIGGDVTLVKELY